MTDEEKQAFSAEYLKLSHAIQSGIALALEFDPTPGKPKHLRVGNDLRASEHAALVRTLIKAGVITEQAYCEEVLEELRREKERHEERLLARYGRRVELG